MINAIIVDDEPLALDIIESHIEKVPQIQIVARCNNALEANEALRAHAVDLMFLDIQMPQLTGTDFLKTLANPPVTIFTTAYDNYAVEGFELNALDYLLKPISLDRFLKAANKAVATIELQRGGNQLDAPAALIDENEDFMFVKADKKLVKVNYADVVYIEGMKDYVIIRLSDTRIITLQTMKSLEVKLPAHIFQRIHRSYIVNVNRINAVEGNIVEVTEKGKTKILPVGKNYREKVQQLVNKNRL